MKLLLRKIFYPLLNIFEAGEGDYDYKPSHRTVLIVIGALFSGLALIVLKMAIGQDAGYFLAVLVFGLVGVVTLIIGLLGNDRAVAKIWGSTDNK